MCKESNSFQSNYRRCSGMMIMFLCVCFDYFAPWANIINEQQNYNQFKTGFFIVTIKSDFFSSPLSTYSLIKVYFPSNKYLKLKVTFTNGNNQSQAHYNRKRNVLMAHYGIIVVHLLNYNIIYIFCWVFYSKY